MTAAVMELLSWLWLLLWQRDGAFPIVHKLLWCCICCTYFDLLPGRVCTWICKSFYLLSRIYFQNIGLAVNVTLHILL